MPTLLTFGDSNTHGTLPIKVEGQRERLGPNARWPGITAATLGPEWTLVEEGLPGAQPVTRTRKWDRIWTAGWDCSSLWKATDQLIF